ncbi:response regulator, partial [Sphingomonas sp. ABOLF]|uniref:response regulator n=1 Tax=Sphingomonas sp. ABOLF TaxID=1985879 RepID=UPI000F7EDB1D
MTRNGQRLLMVIDDDPAQRRLISVIAARRSWRTIFADDVDSALETLATPEGLALDAILLDHRFPDTETELAGLIAALRRNRPALPLLMLTADGSVAQAVAAMRAGASDFLVKPLVPERLLSALDAAAGAGDTGELRPLAEKRSMPLAFDEV